MHLCLIAIAQNSDNQLLTCHLHIPDLPVHLKQHLLSYIAAYRSNGITRHELQTLLPANQHPDPKSNPGSCPEDFRHLDLSGSIGSSVTLDQLNGFLAGPMRVRLDFTSLTHLCLARPGPNVSWLSLLSFAREVRNLTHLSLAYWSSVPSDHGTGKKVKPMVSISTSLSSLSKSLTELQYLDLEGCTSWISLLGITDIVDWTGGWKHVRWLNLSQGPMPLEVQFEEDNSPATYRWIREELRVRRVEESINWIRNVHGLQVPPVLVEHGWDQKNCLIKSLIETTLENHERRVRFLSRRPLRIQTQTFFHRQRRI